MTTSAIVLAGGSSNGFGEDKGILKLAGKPLISYVVDVVRKIADETIVVTSSVERVEKYKQLVPDCVKFVVDTQESNGPLIGALTGFSVASGDYALVVPFDTPFVSKEIVSLLFDLCVGRSAVVPRWPNGQIEPLHAVYQVKASLAAAEAAVAEGKLDMIDIVERLRGVRFLSTMVITEIDPELESFFSISTPLDLKKAAVMMKPKRAK